MLQQAFGETALSQSKTFEWCSRFKNGHKSIDDHPHTGCPSTAPTNENVNHVNAVIHGNRRLTIREIADELSMSFGTCQVIQMVFRYLASAPRHVALSAREFLAKHSIPMVPHWPYSPDVAPCNIFLFPRLKSTLKGKRFQDVAEV
jgi:hypothetical protein